MMEEGSSFSCAWLGDHLAFSVSRNCSTGTNFNLGTTRSVLRS
jgi:hypothetical protein